MSSSASALLLKTETDCDDTPWWLLNASEDDRVVNLITATPSWRTDTTAFRQKIERPKHAFSPRKPNGKKPNTANENIAADKIETTELTTINASGHFVVLRQWEGYVLKAEADSFFARLVDPLKERSDEEAEFSVAEIPSYDHDLVAPGAVFYWTVGFQDSAAGTRTRASTIRFRRLPVWSASELEKAKANAKHILGLFD